MDAADQFGPQRGVDRTVSGNPVFPFKFRTSQEHIKVAFARRRRPRMPCVTGAVINDVN